LTINEEPYLDDDGYPIMVFSDAIGNKKNAGNEELHISEASLFSGTCAGDDKVLLFVNKVDKKNIQVRFFEKDFNGSIIWEDFGKFSDNDVWHQYGICFYTPPYKNQNIKTRKMVSMPTV
jgi:nuclear factor NF-kappa-B p105 subunit